MQIVEGGKIVTLQQVVREFSEGDTTVITVQTLFHRFFIDHLVNREVLTDITQESQHVHAAEPVIVIGGDSAVFATAEIQERRNLLADFLNPFIHGFIGVQLTLRGFKARIADQTGCATHQSHWLVPVQLKAFQAKQRHQMSQMQAVCGRIETAIECNWPLRQSLC
ncbi:hypothetical protein SRABI106_03432 [Rahnella aquatilis]|nr:hypothetical protein SRABI106_03432 [Rahnella aquatilis]